MQLKPYHTAFQRSFCLTVITEVECLKTRVSKQNDQVGDDVDVTVGRLQSLHTLHTLLELAEPVQWVHRPCQRPSPRV